MALLGKFPPPTNLRGSGEIRGPLERHIRTLQAAVTNLVNEAAVTNLVNGPKGHLGYAEKTDIQGSIRDPQDIAGLSLTFDAGTSRLIRTTVFVYAMVSAQTTATGQGFITDGSNNIVQSFLKKFSGTTAEDGFIMQIVEPLSGLNTRKARYRALGNGLQTWVGDPTAPSYILVEDIGPA